jgi:hypothetical protein
VTVCPIYDLLVEHGIIERASNGGVI